MISIELKNQVKERIDQVNDAYLLEEILNLIDFETSKEELFSIPSDHQKELDISIAQMKKGQTSCHTGSTHSGWSCTTDTGSSPIGGVVLQVQNKYQ
ncbi:MAG: hypothetical protein WAT46_18570 [Saprospiraceae bacterium]